METATNPVENEMTAFFKSGASGSARDESFRDAVATINKQGKRSWIFPQQPKGPLYNARTIVSIVFLALLFGLPFVRVNGHPLFLFNVLERRFIFFGVTFWPQDFYLFFLGMLTFIVFIIVFTVAFGRLFCGWACPQTIFMEQVFRRIEYWIEGDAAYQRQLDKAPWTAEKIRKRVLKHSIFFLIAFLIANAFFSYIIGTDEVFGMYRAVGANAGTFAGLLIFSGVFYGVFAWFREQVCLIVCPYGRLQGVLLDKNSIVVAYDYVRGEQRGKIKKKEQRTLGDCIDCNQCVKVCPTGIDIRNGTQLECVNCTACIDACNRMMESVGFEKGLIRYASENNIAEKTKLRMTPRMIAYSAVLFLLTGVLTVLLITRKDVATTVLRAPGLIYQELPGNRISNLYKAEIVNKTYTDLSFTLRLEDAVGEISVIGNNLNLEKSSVSSRQFFITLDRNQIHHRKNKLHIGIWVNGKKIDTVEASFIGPVS